GPGRVTTLMRAEACETARKARKANIEHPTLNIERRSCAPNNARWRDGSSRRADPLAGSACRWGLRLKARFHSAGKAAPEGFARRLEPPRERAECANASS